jgi:epimerase transport system membrane fusion protein
MQQHIDEHHERLERTHISSKKLGFVTIMFIFGFFGLWSIFAKVEMTITANGKVITDTYNKSIMHPRGGIVEDMFVKEGDYVKKDQPLLKLDSTDSQSELDSNIKKNDRDYFLVCKFEAESKLENEFDCSRFYPNIIDKNNSVSLEKQIKAYFLSDMRSLNAKIDLLQKKNKILQTQNEGLQKQIKTNKEILASYKAELKKWKKLLKSQAVDEMKLIETQRKIKQIQLDINTLENKINENKVTILTNEQQIVLEKESFSNQAQKDLNDIRFEISVVQNKMKALKNIIKNATIKAPSAGVVTDMQIHSSQEVVPSQKQIMAIVPENNKLVIEAYILPTDIEKVYKGQKAEISFPAFVDPSALPIYGKVTYVSADAILEPKSGNSFYHALVEVTPDGLEAIKKNGFKIVPGMPATVFIKTGKITLMEYLMQPIILLSKGIFHAN